MRNDQTTGPVPDNVTPSAVYKDISVLSFARDTDELALRGVSAKSRELALSLLATTPDCVKLLDVEGRLLFMNYGGLCAMEIDRAPDVLGKYWWDLWPEGETENLRRYIDLARQGRPTEFVAFCPTAKGAHRWWAVSVSGVLSEDEDIKQILAVSRDVTALVARQSQLEQALAESEMLRREVDHRVKNSLGLVSSMLNLKARNAGDERVSKALLDASMRVRTIASVHDKLYRSSGEGVPLDDYIRTLAEDIQHSVGGSVHLQYVGRIDERPVDPEVSLALGLVIAELSGNALRHAQLGPDDRIDVDARIEGDTCIVSVRDTGCGLPEGFSPQTAGMGMTVIQSMVAKIGGQFSWATPADGGTLFAVSFPIGGDRAAPTAIG